MNKPEIAAMEALKEKAHPDAGTRNTWNAAIDACIATLSNHVVIPEGDFVGIFAAIVDCVAREKNGFHPNTQAMKQAFKLAHFPGIGGRNQQLLHLSYFFLETNQLGNAFLSMLNQGTHVFIRKRC